MPKHEPHHLPHLGARSIKTAIAATLCAVLYSLIDRNPTFACIGAVFGMDNGNMQHPWQSGGNRLAGTVLGGFTGMVLFYISCQFNSRLLSLFLLFFGILLLICVSLQLHLPGAIQPGSVVFYIVMLNTPQNQYISYALNRMIDTGIGVIVAVLINWIYIRHHYNLQRMLRKKV